MDQPLVVPIDDRRVRLAERLDLAGNAAAAVTLLVAGLDALPGTTAAATAFAAVEVAAAAALAGVVVREARAGDDGAEARVSWVGLAAAAVLLVEWYGGWRGGGKLWGATLVTALVTLATALLHPVIQRRRRARRVLRIDGDGVDLRMGRFRRFHARWDDVAAVRAEGTGLRVHMADGTVRSVSLRTVRNRAEVADAVVAAAAARLPPAGPADG